MISLLLVISALIQQCQAGLLFGGAPIGNTAYANIEEVWEPVFRIYAGSQWNSHADFLSPQRSAQHGNKHDSQFRSWSLDRWHAANVQKVKVEVYHDGFEVVEMEFAASASNITAFFSQANLRKSTFADLPLGGAKFIGDDFSLDGDSDARHWVVSSRHQGNCRNDEGWFQVLDKPKPGRDRCVCSYENVDKYPTIMYAKGNRKAKWSEKAKVGYADMMQVSVSHVPYIAPVPPTQPTQPQTQPLFPNTQPLFPQQQPHNTFSSNTMFNFELKK